MHRRALVWIRRLAREVRTQDQDACWNAGAVEQIWRQANDGLDQILFEKLLPDFLFGAPSEQHAVRHDSGHHADRFADRKHVLSEHEVTFLAGGGAPAPTKALGKLHVAARVVLAERRICDNAIETLQFAGLAVHRVKERVLKLDVRVGAP